MTDLLGAAAPAPPAALPPAIPPDARRPRLRANVRPRVVVATSAASLAILVASIPTGFGTAGSILVATLWIRVGADAITAV